MLNFDLELVSKGRERRGMGGEGFTDSGVSTLQMLAHVQNVQNQALQSEREASWQDGRGRGCRGRRFAQGGSRSMVGVRTNASQERGELGQDGQNAGKGAKPRSTPQASEAPEGHAAPAQRRSNLPALGT